MNQHPKRQIRTFAMTLLGITALLVATAGAAKAQAPRKHTLGIGAHFFRTVDSFNDLSGIDEDGNSWVVSYQYLPRGLFRFEIDLEYFPDGFSGSLDTAFAPQFFVLVGHGLYGGIGVGQTFADDLIDDATDPYYMARFGWELGILGAIGVDLQATYLFDNWDDVRGFDINSDTLTVGAVLRFDL